MSPSDISSLSIRQPDYPALAEFRYQIRRFLHFSEQAAREARMEPRQHQFLLALKGLPSEMRPNIGTLANRMQIRSHSAVELVNRLAKRGLVQRRRVDDDGREVELVVTAKGEAVLHRLSLHHRAELQSAGPALMTALNAVLRPNTAKKSQEKQSKRKKIKEGNGHLR
jgi:DNA-binding MarR family transcriptional regulator